MDQSPLIIKLGPFWHKERNYILYIETARSKWKQNYSHLFPTTIFCHVRAPSLPISLLLLFLVCAPLHNLFTQCTPHLPHLGQSALTSCTHKHNCLLPCCACGRRVISLGKQSEVLHLQVSRCCLIPWSLQSTHAWLRSAVYCSLKSKHSKGLLIQCISCINSYSSINKEQNLLHL